MNRRRKILLGAAALGVAAYSIRPARNGAPHIDYFRSLSLALKHAGIATPMLIVDRARLQQNAQRVRAHLAPALGLRIVVKSLPAADMLREVCKWTGTQRMMVFSLPHLMALRADGSDKLLGKPMPVDAARQFLLAADQQQSDKVQWLIDTPERLAQYSELAQQSGRTLQVNLEVDVGLHRGGFSNAEDFTSALQILKSNPRLTLQGLMGYDAHVAKIPDLPGLRDTARRHARASYQAFADLVKAQFPNQSSRPWTFNAGGSPTYRHFDGTTVENEVSVGSAMVKPSDFDLPGLEDLVPATFIATPVLKALSRFQMPYGVEWIGGAAQVWDRNQDRAYFVYGGNWLADPVSPSGLAPSGLYGTSSNQQVLLGSGLQGLRVDDFVFFRPRQSEAVMTQFGDIGIFEGGNIVGTWSPFQATG